MIIAVLNVALNALDVLATAGVFVFLLFHDGSPFVFFDQRRLQKQK